MEITMKKILSVILCAAMALAIASCDTAEAPSIETKSGKDNDKTEATTEAISVPSDTAEGFNPEFTFSTTDRDGNTWDASCFSSNKVTMINFWEPWCGPCCKELPDLTSLYEKYKDQGFQILGVYSETHMESDVRDILSKKQVSYPILHYTSDFDQFQTGYVPTTIFVDSQGHVITIDGEKTVVGSRSYEDWEKIVKPLLG